MMVMSVMSNTMVTFDMMVMSDMNGHDSHDTESQDGNVCHDGHVWHDGHDIMIILAIIIAVSPPGTY